MFPNNVGWLRSPNIIRLESELYTSKQYNSSSIKKPKTFWLLKALQNILEFHIKSMIYTVYIYKPVRKIKQCALVSANPSSFHLTAIQLENFKRSQGSQSKAQQKPHTNFQVLSLCSTKKHEARSTDELTHQDQCIEEPAQSLLSDSHPDVQGDALNVTRRQAAMSLSDHASSTSRQTDPPSSFYASLGLL